MRIRVGPTYTNFLQIYWIMMINLRMKCILLQIRQGHRPPARSRAKDGGADLQRGRQHFLLQRPGGVRPDPHRRHVLRRQRTRPHQLQLQPGRVQSGKHHE